MSVDAGLLAAFLREPSDDRADAHLAELFLQHVTPIVESVVRRRLGVSLSRSDTRQANQDGFDVVDEVRATLMGELRHLRETARAAPDNFSGYVAGSAHNACNDFYRRRYPERRRLKNRLRYVLTHDRAFTLRLEGDTWVAGLADAAADGQVHRDAAATRNQPATALTMCSADGPIAHAWDLLRASGGSMALDSLLETIARATGLLEPTATPLEELHGQLIEAAPQADDVLIGRADVEALWVEVRALPVAQRTALLLNLRDPDGGDALAQLPLTGIASIRQIAGALELEPREFAELWRMLPLEDSAIARRLGVTRQQVINLRKAARARLARRTAHVRQSVSGR
jgi:hypothetical protein